MRQLRLFLALFLCIALLLSGCAGAADTPPPAPLTSAPPQTLKVLSIGGSFSVDAMEYLYQIAQDAGVKEITLGILSSGGASLSKHLGFAQDNSRSYTYFKNTAGTWEETKKCRMSDILAEEQWDYITLQQTSGASGRSDTYKGVLPQLIEYVRSKNSSAKLVWHMTWAYQADSTHAEFSLYEKNQQKMYEMILSCLNEHILPESRFSFIIPAGTAIQNARTSFLGDTLTRDGYHLDLHIGRYIAGLTWFAALTNSPVDSITYNPDANLISDDMLSAAREAATNAILTPYAVTQSAITQGVRP